MGGVGTKLLQASEIIKVTYGGLPEYKYSFSATKSGLTASYYGISHNGNYELTVQPVPEPTTMLGLALGASGLLAVSESGAKPPKFSTKLLFVVISFPVAWEYYTIISQN